MTADVLPEPVTPVIVTEPGVYLDMPVDAYHADPVPERSLSCSGAKKLLPPSCPAIFKWERDNGQAPKRQFDLGHAAHSLVLGVGADIVVIDADNYKTKAAQEQQREAREAGAAPLLRSEWETVQAMAIALRQHPIASKLVSDGGQAEVSIFWRDDKTDVMRRCRLDWRPSPRDGRAIGWDYKTAVSANPEKFTKAAMDYGYHQQAPFYIDGLKAEGLADDDAQFLYVVQEKTPPYLVSVVQLDATDIRIGRLLNRRAIDLYAECVANDRWPGYADDEVAHVSLPYFYERQFEDEL